MLNVYVTLLRAKFHFIPCHRQSEYSRAVVSHPTLPSCTALLSDSRRNLVSGTIFSFFWVLNVDWTSHWPISKPPFNSYFIYRSGQGMKIWTKHLLLMQKLIFALKSKETQVRERNWFRTLASLSSSFKSHLFQRKEVWLKFLKENWTLPLQEPITFVISSEFERKMEGSMSLTLWQVPETPLRVGGATTEWILCDWKPKIFQTSESFEP